MTSHAVISTDPETMGGTPVFRGTRVHIQTLFDYLSGGDSLEFFLENYPSVSREQALQVLELAGRVLVTAYELPRVANATAA